MNSFGYGAYAYLFKMVATLEDGGNLNLLTRLNRNKTLSLFADFEITLYFLYFPLDANQKMLLASTLIEPTLRLHDTNSKHSN